MPVRAASLTGRKAYVWVSEPVRNSMAQIAETPRRPISQISPILSSAQSRPPQEIAKSSEIRLTTAPRVGSTSAEQQNKDRHLSP